MSRTLCVIGDPVHHSKSPLLHNTMCRVLGLDFTYHAQTVKADALPDFLAQAKAEGYAGFNATMPFKELLLPYLDGLDPLAEKLGAANTVCIKDSKLYGYNTDCPGYIAALKGQGFDPKGKNVVLLGAGGAAKAVAVGLCEAGARVAVSNRTAERVKPLMALYPDRISALPWLDQDPTLPVHPSCTPPIHPLHLTLSTTDLLVNATSLGMAGQGQFSSFAFLHSLPKTCLVSDLIYHPSPTALLEAADGLGLKTMDGLPLLIHQAILALEHFAEVKIDPAAVLPALEEALKG